MSEVGYTLETVIKELKRELAMRKNFYPKLVQQGKMTPEERDRRIVLMEIAVNTLQHKLDQEALDLR